MDTLTWTSRPERLREPVLVAAFEGWNDAGASASMALSFVGRELSATPIASIDCEAFYDLQENRPTIDLSGESGSTRLTWPDLTVSLASGGQRDLVLVSGAEPTFRWRAFTATILEIVDALGIGLAVTLGSLLSDQAHTRPVVLTGIATDPALLGRLETRRPSYQGPTGIVGVLHDAFRAHGIAAASLWAPVPHYAAGVPNPKGALTLVEGLSVAAGLSLDLGELVSATADHERQLTSAVERDPRLRALVEHLEEASDDPAFDPGNLPTGDDLAAELERFLRERDADGES